MGRRKGRIKRGLWSPDEDARLVNHIRAYGLGLIPWSAIPAQAGIQRCGKSCRFRWMNYLRPGLKRGIAFSQQEQELILHLHRLLGNRWSEIASYLPGRTDNAVKNFCNVVLRKQTLPKLTSESEAENPNANLIKDREKEDIACSTLVMNKQAVINPNPRSSNVNNVGLPQDNTTANQWKRQPITNRNSIPSSFDHYGSNQFVSSQLTSYLDPQVIMKNNENGALTSACAAVKPDDVEDGMITSRDMKSADNQDNWDELAWVSDTQHLLLQLMQAEYTNSHQCGSENNSRYCSSHREDSNIANDLLSTAGAIMSNGNDMRHAVGIFNEVEMHNVVVTDETVLRNQPNHKLVKAADHLICANDDMMCAVSQIFNCDYHYMQSY